MPSRAAPKKGKGAAKPPQHVKTARKDANGRVVYKSVKTGEDKVRVKSATTGKLMWRKAATSRASKPRRRKEISQGGSLRDIMDSLKTRRKQEVRIYTERANPAPLTNHSQPPMTGSTESDLMMSRKHKRNTVIDAVYSGETRNIRETRASYFHATTREILKVFEAGRDGEPLFPGKGEPAVTVNIDGDDYSVGYFSPGMSEIIDIDQNGYNHLFCNDRQLYARRPTGDSGVAHCAALG